MKKKLRNKQVLQNTLVSTQVSTQAFGATCDRDSRGWSAKPLNFKSARQAASRALAVLEKSVIKMGANARTLAMGLVAAMFMVGGAQASDAKTDKAAKPDAQAGSKIAQQVCVACHGADGNSVLPVNPNLAGQHPEYLYKQLKDFKSVDGATPARQNAIMAGFVATLSEADMRNVAAWYGSQTLKPAVATDKDLAEKGRAIWRGGIADKGVPACAGCHGPTGAGMPVQYPVLAGQHAEYSAAQLTAWRQGERGNSVPMSAISARLSDLEIKALAEYAAGLR